MNKYDSGIFLIEFVARFLHNPQSLICNPKSCILNLSKNQNFEFKSLLHSQDAELLENERKFILQTYLTDTIPQEEQATMVSAKPPWFDGSVTTLRRKQIKNFLIDLASMDRDG